MIQVFLGLTKNSVLMDGKGPNLHLPKYMQSNMYPLGCKGIKRVGQQAQGINSTQ